MTQRVPASILSVWMAAVACGGGQQAAEDPSSAQSTSEVTAESSAAPAPALAWADMNREQRLEYMGLTIVPEMKKLFQANDPKAYAEFTCKTCHGEDMQAVDYKMPNGLFALEKPDPMPAAMDYDAETTKFMAEQVVPRMAELLGNDAFNCFNCHDAEE